MSSSHRTSSTSAVTRLNRASPSRGDGAPLPLNSNRTLEIQVSPAAAGHDGAYCGVTTCTSDVTAAAAATDVAVTSCRSPTTTLDFPASPSAEETSASPFANPSASAWPHDFPMSPPFADCIPWPSESVQFNAIDVALEDWLNEAAASVVETAAPTVLGRKQRRRLMRQWFHDAPDGLIP